MENILKWIYMSILSITDDIISTASAYLMIKLYTLIIIVRVMVWGPELSQKVKWIKYIIVKLIWFKYGCNLHIAWPRVMLFSGVFRFLLNPKFDQKGQLKKTFSLQKICNAHWLYGLAKRFCQGPCIIKSRGCFIFLPSCLLMI